MNQLLSDQFELENASFETRTSTPPAHSMNLSIEHDSWSAQSERSVRKSFQVDRCFFFQSVIIE